MIVIHLEGSDVTDLLCTVSLLGPHAEAAAEAGFIAWLKERGYSCEHATDWETPAELAARLHIRKAFLSQALRRANSPKPLDIAHGPTGRILYLRSTPALDTHLTRHKTQNPEN